MEQVEEGGEQGTPQRGRLAGIQGAVDMGIGGKREGIRTLRIREDGVGKIVTHLNPRTRIRAMEKEGTHPILRTPLLVALLAAFVGDPLVGMTHWHA